MRKSTILSVSLLIFLVFTLFLSVQNSAVIKAEEKYVSLDISLLNQDPYPAQPNDYVSVVFKIEHRGGGIAEDVLVEILPEYPFSLDSGVSPVKEIGLIRGSQYGEKSIFVKYKLRVDKDAINGENEIRLRYTYNSQGSWEHYSEKKFNITIDDPKTDFDVAVQDYSYKTNTLSLAISNIGDTDANSVTVSLPEQNSIEILGSDKNILGGIKANDYTIASFKVVPKQDGAIVVRIAYTDSIGIRREIEKAVIFKASSYNQKIEGSKVGDYRALLYIVIGVVGIIIIFVLFKILRKQRKK